jgi:hypothetical protein
MTTLGRGESIRVTVRKRPIYGRCLRIRCETEPSRCGWEHVDQYRLKPLQREVVRPYTRVELGESKRKSSFK